ncbi:acid phosphatase [Sistotremastrum niveocremeum HHB9708]|uniref:Phytase A n=1 Tax=Sistotremastrum niveocremeum HHB9708 TaxID=1314777 RepID=A0A164N9R5_9AGAM|nr:acid phosphatase [Sistotremastrum niveocremeum HHB9708]
MFSNIVFALVLFPYFVVDNVIAFKPVTPNLGLPVSISHNLAEYSPYFPSALYSPPPLGCEITQARYCFAYGFDETNFLERHGARFPTASAGAKINATIAKFKNVKKYEDNKLAFLRKYTYDLGHDVLVGFGAAQSYDAGQLAAQRYGSLVSSRDLPFVRASSSSRVVDSSTNWTSGFIHNFRGHLTIQPPVVLSEAGNDTLDDSDCPNAGSSDAANAQWLAAYAPPIAARLNAGAPGANLTNADAQNLLSLCAFDSVAKEKASPFCDVFTVEEFELFEYSGDIDKFYDTGYGQQLGRVQGVGYVNELIARLTDRPVIDHTESNTTLDSSSTTFPLNRALYADFSHDNQMIAIYSALGLFRQPAPLNTTKPNSRRTWLASKLVPFSATLVTERLQCGFGKSSGAFVRMLVDDAVQPLEFCGSGDGLCGVQSFVNSQSYARSQGNGDFAICFS